MPTRRKFLGGLAGAASGAFAFSARGTVARPRDRKPNLLFLLADDHAGYVFHADGNPRAQTPVLDHLASQSTRFAANYCNAPVCTPSRQSILTGQLPHSAGVTVLGTPLDESKPTLAKQLDASGYLTAVFGKMHFNRPGTPGMHGFQIACTEDVCQTRWLHDVGPEHVPEGIRTKPRWRPFKDPARIWLNADGLPFPRVEAEMKNTWQANAACQFLTEHRHDPFALWVSFQDPTLAVRFPHRGPKPLRSQNLSGAGGWPRGCPADSADFSRPHRHGQARHYRGRLHLGRVSEPQSWHRTRETPRTRTG